MICKVFSTLPSFKTLEFTDGLNIILAEKASSSDNKNTRNRTGKTSFIRIVHFLLGASSGKNSYFQKPELLDSTFGMEFILNGHKLSIMRSGKKPLQIILSGDLSGIKKCLPEYFKYNITQGSKHTIPLGIWKSILFENIFGINQETPDKTFQKYKPSFRALISYLIRKNDDYGFSNPLKHSSTQQPWAIQVNLSFLLKLPWKPGREMQLIRDEEKVILALLKVAKSENFEKIIGESSKLYSEIAILEEKVKQLKAEISNFKVLNEYHELETEASSLTQEINEFASQNIIDKNYINRANRALKEEKMPTHVQIEKLYKEVNIFLPELVSKRFEEVRGFHDSVIKNRKYYLQSEIKDIQDKLEKRNVELAKKVERRAEILGILKNDGALDHFLALQDELIKIRNKLESTKKDYQFSSKVETKQTENKLERIQFKRDLIQEFDELGDARAEIALAFSELSKRLYGTASGNFEVTATENGPTFSPTIHGIDSQGVKNMQIFCLDLMAMELWKRESSRPTFLIHDSHLFEGVDERQKLNAMKVGSEYAKAGNYQYIITINSDELPEPRTDFNPNSYIIKQKLIDSEDGGLFGIRFD